MATAKKTSTALAPTKKSSGAVVSIKEQLKAQAEAMSNRVAPPSGVSIRVTQDKKFVLPDGQKTSGPLELVVVDFVSRNEFYEGAYDKDNLSPPACFAIAPEPKGMVPSDNSPAKQCDDCTSCPNNAFGSAGAGKACKNTRLLAVLPPDADADTPLWLLKVSPTGLKKFDGFVNSVARTFQVPPVGVVVSVGFDEGNDYPSLTFADPQPNENLELCFSRQGEAKELLMREPDVTGYEAPAPKSKAVGKAKPAATRR